MKFKQLGQITKNKKAK